MQHEARGSEKLEEGRHGCIPSPRQYALCSRVMRMGWDEGRKQEMSGRCESFLQWGKALAVEGFLPSCEQAASASIKGDRSPEGDPKKCETALFQTLCLSTLCSHFATHYFARGTPCSQIDQRRLGLGLVA